MNVVLQTRPKALISVRCQDDVLDGGSLVVCEAVWAFGVFRNCGLSSSEHPTYTRTSQRSLGTTDGSVQILVYLGRERKTEEACFSRGFVSVLLSLLEIYKQIMKMNTYRAINHYNLIHNV